jgi:phosphoribosylanthranilate isomerase
VKPTATPRVKVCCIVSLEEARLAVASGADALGLVSEMPSGPGVIDEDRIADIAAAVPDTVETWLLTSRQIALDIVDQFRQVRTTAVQIVDQLAPGGCHVLRGLLPGVPLVQVIHVAGPESLDEALAIAPLVDALLLDSGNRRLAVKQLGGTGRVHDWSVSRQIREAVEIPVWLAGGLRPGNVLRALEEVGPYGLDVCTGVRVNGRLDPATLDAFMRAAGRD